MLNNEVIHDDDDGDYIQKHSKRRKNRLPTTSSATSDVTCTATIADMNTYIEAIDDDDEDYIQKHKKRRKNRLPTASSATSDVTSSQTFSGGMNSRKGKINYDFLCCYCYAVILDMFTYYYMGCRACLLLEIKSIVVYINTRSTETSYHLIVPRAVTMTAISIRLHTHKHILIQFC